MKMAKKEVTARMVKNAIERFPDFNTERKARSFASGYIDRVWILKGPGRYRSHFLVADLKSAVRLKKNGFQAIEA